MNKSERVTVVLATAEALWNLDHEARTITMEEFGIEDPTPDDVFGNGPTIGQLLRTADEENLLQLARHLGVDLPQSAQSAQSVEPAGAAATAAAAAVPVEPLFVFASHLSKYKKLTWDVSEEMKLYGIELFVAHVSIPDDSPWQDEIPNGLNKAHAGVAFLHQGFRESDWCDQEVGWLLGRGIPLLGLTFDTGPYGPMGRLQAAAAGKMTPEQIADNLVTRLSAKPQLQANLTASFAKGLAVATRFRTTDRIWQHLREFTGVSPDLCRQLLRATQVNDQVYNARSALDGSRPYPRVILDFLRSQPGWPSIQTEADAYAAALDAKSVPV